MSMIEIIEKNIVPIKIDMTNNLSATAGTQNTLLIETILNITTGLSSKGTIMVRTKGGLTATNVKKIISMINMGIKIVMEIIKNKKDITISLK